MIPLACAHICALVAHRSDAALRHARKPRAIFAVALVRGLALCGVAACVLVLAGRVLP